MNHYFVDFDRDDSLPVCGAMANLNLENDEYLHHSIDPEDSK